MSGPGPAAEDATPLPEDSAGPSPDAMPTGRRRGQVLSLGMALILSSGLGFVLLAIVARWLTQDQNALFLSVWGIVFGFGSVLASSEQEIARQTAVARLEGRPAPASVGQWTLTGLAATGATLLVLALVARDRMFLDSWSLVALTALALIGFAGQFLTRGLFLGGGSTGAYAAVVVLEAALRVVPAGLLLVLAVRPSIDGAVAAVVLGCWGWAVLWPRLRGRVDVHGHRQPWGRVAAGLGTLAAGNALSSLVLTAFPTLVTLMLGSGGLAVLFAVVTLSRVPLVLMSPVQAMVVPVAVEYLHAGRASALAALQIKGAVLMAAAAAFLAGSGWVLGPWAVRLLFGADYAAAPATVAVALATSAVIALALMQVAVFIALERYPFVALTWGLAVGAAVAVLGLWPAEPELVGLTAFAAASVTAYVVSGLLLRASLARR